MKKLFLALSVLAMLIFAAVPSQALVSMPDAVPGQDVLLPFFLSAIDGGETTLLVIQEVNGTAQTFKVYVNDVDSDVAYNDVETLSGNDVGAWNVRTDWILNASTTGKDMLTYDLDGDTVNDHYVGYVDLQNWTTTTSGVRTVDKNDNVAYIYQIDLAKGIASGAICPAREYEGNTQALTDGMVSASYIELFNAQAMAAAKANIASVTVAAATSFRMLPRYYVYNSDAKNYLFSWRSTTTSKTFDWNFYDEGENPLSGPVTISHELDIINVVDIVPAGHMAAYPYAGWVNMTADVGFDQTDEWVMFNYQKVVGGTVGTNWNALFAVHRDVGTG